MIDRRSFLRSLAAGGAAIAVHPAHLLASRRCLFSPYFGVHAFVESHQDAVFIMRTSVDVKTNSTAMLQCGLTFGSSVFVPMDSPGIPITHRIVLKPNLVGMPTAETQYMGMVTDPHFVEGLIQSLKLLGCDANQFYIREVNGYSYWTNSGYTQLADRTGADLRRLDAPVGTISESDLQWIDVPGGKWFKRIAYLWPVNAPDSWLLNIAKFKTHLMGMTLCAKNLQGALASPYVQHCNPNGYDPNIDPAHIQPDANAHVWDDYLRHKAAGVPRWDRPDGVPRQETWAARCLDNNSVTHPGLHIIEGIYGREGSHAAGPGVDGKGIDYMTNIIVFGKNPFHVDNIGLWLGGHEPGNFGLLHMAIERGQASFLNPHDIPLYEWYADGSAESAALEEFSRSSLRTQYLRRDYDGQTEDDWHLVHEAYDYDSFVVNLKVMLEGPYVSGAMSTDLNSAGFLPTSQPYSGSPWNYDGTESVETIPAGVVDWILVEIRSEPAAASRVARRAAFIKSDGTIVDLNGVTLLRFDGIAPGDYFIVIHHRNHLAIMSAGFVSLHSVSALFDFTTGLDKFYGGDAKALSGGVYGMYAGDVNGNGQVQNDDLNDHLRPAIDQSGYRSADLNLNGLVQESDMNALLRMHLGKGTHVP